MITPDVTLQVQVNAGVAQTGGVVCAVGNSIQLTALSKGDWPTAPATRWELTHYPEGFATPVGWSVDADDAQMPTLYVLGVEDPPAFMLTSAGPYKTRLLVADFLVDERTFIKVPLANGVELIARSEGAQFGGQKQQWLRDMNRALVLLSAGGGGGGGTPSNVAPADVGTTTAGVATAYSRGDHVHAHGTQAGGSLHASVIAAGAAGFMTGADKTKLDGYPSTPTAIPAASGATPADVGAAAAGAAAAFSRGDHVHGHGTQLGGTLHANATVSVAGFLSAADKVKLDGVPGTASDLATTIAFDMGAGVY